MDRPSQSANLDATTLTNPQSMLASPTQPTIRLIWHVGAFAALALLAHGVGIVLAIPVAIGAGRRLAEIAAILFAGIGVLFVSRFLIRRFQGLLLRAIGIGLDRPWMRQLAVGILLGAGLITLAWLVYGWCGWRTIVTGTPVSERWLRLSAGMLFCLVTAFQEEVVCRGYGFQLLYRRSPVLALALGGIVFAVIHIGNTGGASPIALANLFLAHLFFASAYLRTRSLWLPIGLHTGWNFMVAFVFGMPMSGRVPKRVVLSTSLDANVWTGWEFGPEGGFVVTAVLLAATALIWLFIRQRTPVVDLLAVKADQIIDGSTNNLVSTLTVPTAPTQRVLATDVLRGIAVLGILPMNMQIFALFPATVIYPYAGEFTDPVNIAVWTLLRLFIGSKDLMIFSILFGAGILMATASDRGTPGSASALHYRRMAVLCVFGLLHAYLIWAGDILVTYAICGSIVYLLRNLGPRVLGFLGILACAVPLALLASIQFVFPLLPTNVQDSVVALLRPNAETIAHFNQVYGGSWLTQMQERIPDAIANETTNVLFCMGWITGGMMLLGMAMQKHGALTARGSYRSYVLMASAGLFVGLPLLVYSFVWNFARDWSLPDGFFLGWFFRETAYVVIAVGWIGGVMLVCLRGKLPRVTASLGYVGRMALTNYLLQSVLCSLIFYGHGLGLVGRVDHVGQILITFVIWGAQIILSPIWLSRFRFGLAEWAWRSLSYGQWQPMRR